MTASKAMDKSLSFYFFKKGRIMTKSSEKTHSITILLF